MLWNSSKIPTMLYSAIHILGTTSSGRGLLYTGVFDCFIKTLREEGVFGLYKGLTAQYVRVAPHSAINLVCWSQLLKYYYNYFPNSSS